MFKENDKLKEIILLGTRHSIQRGEKREQDFRIFMNHLISTHRPSTIAEEIEDKYIVADIASLKGLNYLIIEPTREEREKLGILDTSIIEHNIFMEFDDHDSDEAKAELQMRKEEVYRAREREWLRRINNVKECPILVICGANHFYPFAKLLNENGYKTIQVDDDWE